MTSRDAVLDGAGDKDEGLGATGLVGQVQHFLFISCLFKQCQLFGSREGHQGDATVKMERREGISQTFPKMNCLNSISN